MIARATGASYPAVTERVVRKSTIPLPPLAEQRRIAAMLDKADAIRRKRREAIRLLEEFLRSAFLDMFGDPVRNPKGWEVVRLQDLCSRVVDCPHSTPKYAAGVTDFPCIRTSDLQGGFLDWSSTKYVKQDHYDERIGRHVPAEGDVLYSREGERFGIGALLPSNTRVCLGQRMMLFRPDAKSVTSAFLWGLLNSGGVYHMANQLVGGSTSPHINVHDIRQFRVYKPPLDLQMTYEKTYLTAAACREKIIGVGTRECEALFNSLAQEAFGGEG
jgi:type I restriction enzyme S subunit